MGAKLKGIGSKKLGYEIQTKRRGNHSLQNLDWIMVRHLDIKEIAPDIQEIQEDITETWSYIGRGIWPPVLD